jgi:hypothetical protein
MEPREAIMKYLGASAKSNYLTSALSMAQLMLHWKFDFMQVHAATAGIQVGYLSQLGEVDLIIAIAPANATSKLRSNAVSRGGIPLLSRS